MNIALFVDGSIMPPNPGGAGGWAAVMVSKSTKFTRHRVVSGSEYNQSNNSMELEAAIQGLRLLGRSRHPVTVYSDSEYVTKGFTDGRVERWAARGYTRGGKRIPNAERWEALNALDIYHDVRWVHLAGQHGDPESFDKHSPEYYAALAHSFALYESRIAHWVKEKNIEGVGVPESLQERKELVEAIKSLPTPPDPPPFLPLVSFAVYQRVGSPRNLLFRGPLSTPISPSLSEDKDGVRDGGRWECHRAAATMNRTDDTREGQRYRGWGIARYVVMRAGLEPTERKSNGNCYYQLTKAQFEDLQKEAGKVDGFLRAIPGGRAGAGASESLAVG